MDRNQYSGDQQPFLRKEEEQNESDYEKRNEEEQNESDYDKAFAKGGCATFCNLFNRNRPRTPPTPTNSLDQLPRPSFSTFNDGMPVEDPELKDYKEVEWRGSKVKYIDIKLGKGKAVKKRCGGEKPSQQVTFNYRFHYDFSSDPIKNIEPEKINLCGHKFGKGFEKGIEGMQGGGIRRIIVPPELTSEVHEGIAVKGYAIYDVELHKVGSSLLCGVRKNVFESGKKVNYTCTSCRTPQPVNPTEVTC